MNQQAIDKRHDKRFVHFCDEGWIQRNDDGNYVIRTCRHVSVFQVKRGRIKTLAAALT